VAADVADWSTAVQVIGGSVTISGIATVSISGTPTVNIAAGQSVSITGTATVSISGTPSVSISGTPTVILGGGTASIGSISAIGSTVTVAGTVNIGNTPSVSISGTPNVNISSGSVSITGTPNINIQSQSVTVAVNLPWTAQGSFTTTGSGSENFTCTAVPAGTQTLGLLIGFSAQALTVQGTTTGIFYEGLTGGPGVYAGWVTIPVNAAADTQYKITWGGSQGAGSVIRAYASGLAMGYPALGLEPMAASVPVVIASDQISVPVTNTPTELGQRNTYSAAANFVPVAGTTHWCIFGSASKTLRIRRIVVSMNKAAAATQLPQLVKFSSALTGGTRTAIGRVPHDSNNQASAADVVCAFYTVASTGGGATVGTIRLSRYNSAPATQGVLLEMVWDFGSDHVQPVVLRGTAEGLGLTNAPADGLTVWVEWTEE